jgi:hypothetical protein
MCVSNEPQEREEPDEELIDTLIAISVLSKRLAEKLREEEKNVENERTVTDPR